MILEYTATDGQKYFFKFYESAGMEFISIHEYFGFVDFVITKRIIDGIILWQDCISVPLEVQRWINKVMKLMVYA